MTTFADQLRALRACCDSIAWVGDRAAEQAWADCEDPQWMLWALGHSTFDRRALNECVIEFATIALEAARPVSSSKPCWAAVESAYRMVVDAIRNGGDLVSARRAAAAYASAASASAAAASAAAASAAAASAASAAAAYAASWAAYAAEDAASAASAAAAYAAEDAASAAAASAAAASAAAYATRKESRAKCCAAIRRHFPSAPILNLPKVTK